MIAGQPYSYLDQAARALGIKALDPDTNNELVHILGDAKPLHEKRDLVVHGIWLPHPDEVHKLWADKPSISRHWTLRKRRWKTDMRGEVISLEEIASLAADIEDLVEWLRDFLSRDW